MAVAVAVAGAGAVAAAIVLVRRAQCWTGTMRGARCVVHGTWCDARACAWCMRMVRVYGVCACPVHALCMPCACPVHAVYAGEPVQHAAAIDDPRVQVAGQQKVELLKKQRDG